MGRNALEHLQDWIRENINDTVYPEDGDDSAANAYAEQYRADAKRDGVSLKEVEAEAGPIEDLIGEAIEASVDAAVSRAMGKDRF